MLGDYMSALNQILDQRNISVRELSRLSNVHPNTLTKYISTGISSDCRLRVYWKIAVGLGIHVENLIYGITWQPASDMVDTPITLYDAVDRKAVWLHTSHLAVHNQIRERLHLDDYATFSAYENYHWVPTVGNAIIIAEYLNCTIDALWGSYFRRKENAR